MENRRDDFSRDYSNIKELLRELRTELSSITGFVQLLNRNAESPVHVKEYAAGISDCCSDMVDLLNLALGQTTAGRQSSAEAGGTGIGAFSLKRLIEEVVGATARERDRKRTHFKAAIHGAKKDHFVGERAKLFDILLNILTNAVEVTPYRGEIKLTVNVAQSEDPNQYDLSFVVTDSGVGISSELQKRIFESDGGLHTLSHARFMADQIGGTLSLQSDPGAGTEVYLGLRLPSASGREKEFFEELGIRRVMIVTPDMQEGERILEEMADRMIPCDHAPTGETAVRIMTGADPVFGAVILDENLADMTVSDFCGTMTKIAPGAPVVLMSEHEERFLESVIPEGVAEVMPKPFFFSVFRQIAIRSCTQTAPGESSEGKEGESFLSGLRFLIAEDNPLNADILKELLELEGARCEIAGNGKAAALMFRYKKPSYYDAILMDIVMPVQNGYDAAKEIRALQREDAKSIPIFAMTAELSQDTGRRAAESGMDIFMEKPLDISTLARELNRIRSARAGSV